MDIQTNLIGAATMLRMRGIEPNGRVQRIFTNECARYMDDYVPFRDGHLKNNRIVMPDRIKYKGPSAHYHYVGKLFLAPSGSAWAKEGEEKHMAIPPRDMDYNGAPKRGPLWDKRMWADKKRIIVKAVAKAAGGKA